MKTKVKLWIVIVILIILSPLGVIIPAYFKAQYAWGEWDTDQLKQLIGYVPKGFDKLCKLWKAPIQDYTFSDNCKLVNIDYMMSAFMGVFIVILTCYVLMKLIVKKNHSCPN